MFLPSLACLQILYQYLMPMDVTSTSLSYMYFVEYM